jgi:hypothetical protein
MISFFDMLVLKASYLRMWIDESLWKALDFGKHETTLSDQQKRDWITRYIPASFMVRCIEPLATHQPILLLMPPKRLGLRAILGLET